MIVAESNSQQITNLAKIDYEILPYVFMSAYTGMFCKCFKLTFIIVVYF